MAFHEPNRSSGRCGALSVGEPVGTGSTSASCDSCMSAAKQSLPLRRARALHPPGEAVNDGNRRQDTAGGGLPHVTACPYGARRRTLMPARPLSPRGSQNGYGQRAGRRVMSGKCLQWAAVLIGAWGVSMNVGATGRSADPEVVIEWNQILEGVVPAGGLSPPRYYAMMHIAMFDAVNSIERSYRPYRFRVPALPAASTEAAAAQAAHDVLAAQFTSPQAQATFDDALRARLANIHPVFARWGVEVGKAVAADVLAWRQNDGWNVTPA